jgi:hypothetical protein
VVGAALSAAQARSAACRDKRRHRASGVFSLSSASSNSGPLPKRPHERSGSTGTEREEGIAVKAQTAYEHARKKLFTDLYADVERDFKEFYVFLNEDESTFKAKLHDKGSSVDLTVDFYGRGMFPPIALHSEGHQDSMGVCLYLALMKKLKSEGFTIAMLDDVMMSIDIGHRRRLCQLLKDRFPDTQFVITTHDRIWARQLKEFQIVKQANLFHFRTWSLESGPVVDTKDAYDAIRDYANRNEIVAE